nr:uncharacterized protein LOC129481677 [Symphalangus syndactylus]
MRVRGSRAAAGAPGRRAGSAARRERHDGRRGSEPVFWRGSRNDAIPRLRALLPAFSQRSFRGASSSSPSQPPAQGGRGCDGGTLPSGGEGGGDPRGRPWRWARAARRRGPPRAPGWERAAAPEGPRTREGSPLSSDIPTAGEAAGYSGGESVCGEEWGLSQLSQRRGEDEGGKFLRNRPGRLRGGGAAARARELRATTGTVRGLHVTDEGATLDGLFVPRHQPARPRNCRGRRARNCGAVWGDDGAVAWVAGQGVAGDGGRIPAKGRSRRRTS